MQTTDTRPENGTPRRTRRPWTVALATFSLVLLAGIAGYLIFFQEENTAEASLATVESLHQAVFAGDWDAFQAMFSPDAISNGQPILGPSFEDGSLASTFAHYDWDGDGEISILDALTSTEMMQYANGRTELPRCEHTSVTAGEAIRQDDPVLVSSDDRVVCHQPSGGAFFDDTTHYEGVWIYGVEDGLITSLELELTPGAAPVRERAGEFRDWVEQNHPELVESLFIPFGTRGAAWVTPENLEVFRATVEEWMGES